MRLTITAAALLLLVSPAARAALPATAPAGADKFHLKPGAEGRGCVACHTTFEDTLKLPFVHTPVKAGACAKCHNPHAASHGKLLAADASRICLQCHADIAPAQPKSVHQAVAEGACVKCHDPHAAKNKNNLLAPESELCFGCHKDMAKAVEAAQFKHNPVTRSCLACHTPHASGQADFLLKKSAPALCLDCHKADQPTFAKLHMNYPVGKADCTTCHDPHGSSSKGMLWASVHPPVMNKMCNQCHPAATEPDATKPKKSGVDLCRPCHSDVVNDIFTKARVHWPVVDRVGCVNCHSPHAAKVKPLLREQTKPLCGKCHGDTLARLAKAAVKHAPVDEGNCAACHAPHASDAPLLLNKKTVLEVCWSCHETEEKHKGHRLGEGVKDMRNPNLSLDCLSCHRAHGSAFKHLAHFDTKMDLCVQCHKQLAR